MVRQYIGARYIPRFTGIYVADRSYEALDVADNGLGTSYIAKIPTPPNTPFSDTTHWAIYGSTSGAIVDLQNQINEMKDSSVEGSLQYQIDENADAISALQNLISNIFNTVADMVSADLDVNTIVSTRGYNNVEDRGSAIYEISDEANEYSITLNNGLYANIISKGAITPQMFGVVSGDTSNITQPKWTKYIKYVNNTAMSYFYLPSGTYNVNEGMILDKPMVGESSHATIQADTTVSGVFDTTKTTTNGYTYNINGLVAIGNIQSYYFMENITINCENNCDYGLYIPEVNKSYFRNIRISRPNLDGLVLARVWMSKFDIINVFRAGRTSFNIAMSTTDIMPSGGIVTSTDFSNLYVQGITDGTASGYAYAIRNVYYSTFKSLACDAYNTTAHFYALINVNGTTFDGVGFEGGGDSNSELIRVNSGSGISFRGITVMGTTMKTLFFIAGTCDISIDSLYMRNDVTCTNYLNIRSSLSSGNVNVNIGGDVVGIFKDDSGQISYLINTPTELKKCVNGVVKNLLA